MRGEDPVQRLKARETAKFKSAFGYPAAIVGLAMSKLLVTCGHVSDDTLMYVQLAVNSIAERAIVYIKPFDLAGTSAAHTPALLLTALTISGLILSLLGKGYETQNPLSPIDSRERNP